MAFVAPYFCYDFTGVLPVDCAIKSGPCAVTWLWKTSFWLWKNDTQFIHSLFLHSTTSVTVIIEANMFFVDVMVGTNLPYCIWLELWEECQADGISVYGPTMRSWSAGKLENCRCLSNLNCAYLSPLVYIVRSMKIMLCQALILIR